MFVKRWKSKASALLAVGLLASFVSETANASIDDFMIKRRSMNAVSISGDSGGRIGSYAMRVASYRRARTLVKFNGRCDSACTLFMGLPSHQTCISSGAYFRFHSPSAQSQRSVRIAQMYMMRKYPGWVRNWISRNNGLSRQLITMKYDYASRFLKRCSTVASR
jgi:hypothetical protein